MNLCVCGCGKEPKPHNRFIHGHNARGALCHNWKGGRKRDTSSGRGYWLAQQPDSPRANSQGYRYEHILIAEKALGKSLDPKHKVHHVDGDGFNNKHDNLVICENQTYHALLHYRTRALIASGHADWLRCHYCGQWDAPAKLLQIPNGHYKRYGHRGCRNEARRLEYARNRARIQEIINELCN